MADERKILLDLGGEKEIPNPSDDQLLAAIDWMNPEVNNAFVILSSDDMFFMQAAGDRKSGFTVEFQEGGVHHHFQSERSFSVQELAQALVSYMQNTDEWREMTGWKRLHF